MNEIGDATVRAPWRMWDDRMLDADVRPGSRGRSGQRGACAVTDRTRRAPAVPVASWVAEPASNPTRESRDACSPVGSRGGSIDWM